MTKLKKTKIVTKLKKTKCVKFFKKVVIVTTFSKNKLTPQNDQLSKPMMLLLISFIIFFILHLRSSGELFVNMTHYLKVGKGHQYCVCTCNIVFCSQIFFAWKKELKV